MKSFQKQVKTVLVLVLHIIGVMAVDNPANLCRLEGAVLQQVNGHDRIAGIPRDTCPLLGRLAGVKVHRLQHVLGVSRRNVRLDAGSKACDL